MADVNLTCTVGGVAVALYSTVQIQEQVSQRSTARFGIVDTANTLTVAYNMRVNIQENGVDKFNGYVDTADRTAIVGSGGGYVTFYDVTAKDCHYLADKDVYTGDELDGMTAGDAVAIVHNNVLAAQGITANYVMDNDHDITTWGAGTQSNTQATADGLQLAFAGSTFTELETTTADFGAGTLTNVTGTNNSLILNSAYAMKLTGLASSLSGTNLYAYYRFKNFTHTVATSDILSYDIWISGDSPDIVGGIDVVMTDGTTMRDSSPPCLDQNQLGSHPNTYMGSLATDQWYHRDIGIPSSLNGKVTQFASIALEGDKAGTYTIYVRNVYWKNSAGVIQNTLFTGPPLALSNKLGSIGYSNLSLSVVTAYEKSGVRVSPAYTNNSTNILRQSLMSWTQISAVQRAVSGITYAPQVKVEVSFDNGYTWQVCTNKAALPNMIAGMSVNGKLFKIRETLSVGGPSPEVAPVLNDVTLTLTPSFVATKNDVINSSLAGDASMATGTLVRLTNDATLGLYITGSYKDWSDGSIASQTIWGSNTPAQATQSIYVGTLQIRVSGVGDGRIQFGWTGNHSDCTIDVDINPQNGNGLYGVVYRTTFWGNANDTYGYFAAINMTAPTSLVLGHGSNSSTGAWTQVAVALGTYTANQWYHMRIEAIGTSHKVYINDVLIITATDSFTTASGGVGVRYYNDQSGVRQSAFWSNFGIIDGNNLVSTRTWTSISLGSVGIVENSVIQWNESTPSACTLVVNASIDGGATYFACTNGQPIPNIGQGANMAGKSLLLQAIFTTANAAWTPHLYGLTALVVSDFQSSGTRTSPAMDISAVGYLGSSSMSWRADVPASTTLTGKTSLDGSTYTTVSSGGAIAGLTSQPAQVADGFTTNTSGNYTKTFQSGGSIPTMTYDTANSKMTISGGVNGHAIWTLANFTYDGTLYAIVYASDAAGFTIRTTDVSNHYRILLTDSTAASNQQKVTLFRMLSGVLTQVGQVSINFLHNSYHTLTFGVLSNVVTISWDGVQVLSYTDVTPTSGVGGAGLYSTTGGSMVVQKLVVQTIGSQALSHTVSSQFILTSSDPLHTPIVKTYALTVRGQQLMTGSVLPSTNFKYKKGSDCVNDAAKQSNMVWKVKTDKSLMLQNRAAALAAWPVWSGVRPDNTSDVQSMTTPKLTYQSPMYRNRQYVTNAYKLLTLTEQKPGDGYTSSWALTWPVDSVTSLDVDGTIKTVSLTATSGYDFYISGSTLSQDSAAPLLTSDQVLSISYVGKEPYVAMKENTTSQAALAAVDGVAGGFSIIANVEDGQGCDDATADALAQQRLDQYCVLSRDWAFSTLRQGLAIATLVSAFVPEYGLNDADFLITGITTTYTMSGALSSPTYDVACSEGPPLGTWTRLFIP